jgi:hypothetical protein
MMKKLTWPAICLIIFLPGCINCDKNDCVEPPLPFRFSIIDIQSKADLVFQDYPRYHPDSIRLYYQEEGKETELQLRILTRDVGYSVFSNQTLPYLSAARDIKDYYLQVSHDDTDTLLLDVKQIDFECCTVFQWAQSFFNGRAMKRSPEDYTVFLLEK